MRPLGNTRRFAPSQDVVRGLMEFTARAYELPGLSVTGELLQPGGDARGSAGLHVEDGGLPMFRQEPSNGVKTQRKGFLPANKTGVLWWGAGPWGSQGERSGQVGAASDLEQQRPGTSVDRPIYAAVGSCPSK